MQMISGFAGDTLEILSRRILSAYTRQKKSLCGDGKGRISASMRLYEAEERLDQTRFVRISNSEIINLKM